LIGFGIGKSNGTNKFLDLHDIYDEKSRSFKNNIEGYYIKPFVGINFNLLDFMYLRMEYEYEFSTFYKKINELNDYPTEAKQMFNIFFGTYIF